MPAKKTTILMVDDDVQLLKIVTHNLESRGLPGASHARR